MNIDLMGLLRRVVGLAGIALVYFGVVDQAGVDAAMGHVMTLAGSVMFLFDFGKSVWDKLPFGKK